MRELEHPWGKVRRSWLTLPAHRMDIVRGAWDSTADVIVLDLNYSVADPRKPQARELMREEISIALKGGAEVFVEVDHELLEADLSAAVWPGLAGCVLPGVTEASTVEGADQLITALEQRRGIRAGEVELHLALDTARANWDAPALIKASPRVTSVSLGRVDLTMDLWPEPGGEIHLLPFLLERLVIVSRATEVVPIGAWWREGARGFVASAEDTATAARRAWQAGLRGAFCQRLDQVKLINHTYGPSEEEIVEAQQLLELLQGGEHSGKARGTGYELVLAPSLRAQVLKLLDWAAACRSKDKSKEEAIQRIRIA